MENKLIKITEGDLHGIISRAASRILTEGNEIRLAQKALYRMGSGMSSVCLRLEGTKYEALAHRMKEAIIALNDALIKDIREER